MNESTTETTSPLTFDRSYRKHSDPLNLHYSGQSHPQPAYLWLDESGEVSVGPDGNINAIPAHVWHGRTLRWRFEDTLLSPEQIDELFADAEFLALLERVHAGHEVYWDGSNHRGRLSEDAQNASFEIDRYLENVTSGRALWDAYDWLESLSFSACVNEGESIEDAAERLLQEAREERIIIDGGTSALEKALYHKRLKEEEEE